MKYGILSSADWNPQIEGWQNGCVCIVRMNDDGTVNVDGPMSRTIVGDVGMGLVYDSDGILQGFIAVPLDVTVHLMYDHEYDAVRFAIHQYTTDIAAIQENVRVQELDHSIDAYIRYTSPYARAVQRAVKQIIIVLIATTIILLLMYARKLGIL